MKILRTKKFYLILFYSLVSSSLAIYFAKMPILKIFGSLVISLIFGMLIQNFFKNYFSTSRSELGFISNKFLRLGIILFGSKLSIDKVFGEGKKTLALAFLVVFFMISITYLLCRFFNVEKELALLVSSGCGICGAAAVMGVSSQINSKTDDSVVAVGVVAILGTVFTFIEVFLRPYLSLTDVQFGIFTGLSLHEIAHALAGGSAQGALSLEIAIIAKLSRVLMLIVLIFILFILSLKNKSSSTNKVSLPYFIVGFIFMSFIGSYVEKVKILVPYISNVAYVCLGMAMFSLGASVNFGVLKKRGAKVLAICFFTSTLLMVLSFIVAKFLY